MKMTLKSLTQSKLFLILAAWMFAMSAQASVFGGYATAEDAMKSDWRVVATRRMAEAAGFKHSSESLQPIYYIVQPTEPVYPSHTGTVVYLKKVGGDWSLQTDYLTITVEILYNQNTGLYSVGNITTDIQTVY